MTYTRKLFKPFLKGKSKELSGRGGSECEWFTLYIPGHVEGGTPLLSYLDLHC